MEGYGVAGHRLVFPAPGIGPGYWKLDLLVASGGVLSHAPRMHQTAMLLIDAFQPEGVTTLAKDSIFMMPHLGVLAQVHPQASMEVFEQEPSVLPSWYPGATGIQA